MKYPYDLFISYSTQNTGVANYLVEKIEKRGFKCFIDHRDISVSSRYAKTIIDGIGNSTAILLIFSSASDNSRYVISEICAAASRNKPIIPVRIENIIPSEAMEFYLGPTQWLDAFPEILEVHIDKIISVLSGFDDNRKDLCVETKTNDAPPSPEIIPNANETQSFKDLQKNAESGDPNAIFKLASMYESIDKTQAVLWYKKAADAGHNRSMFILGAKCQSGLGVEQNISLAFYWFEKAAKNNNTMAMYELGNMYYVDNDNMYYKGVPKDKSQAFYWFKKAAENNHTAAMCQLGDMYYKGEGVPKDKSQAILWYRKAADNGSDEATNKLTKINQSGDNFLNSLSRIWQNMIK